MNRLHPSVKGDKEIKINVNFDRSTFLVYFFIVDAKNKDANNPKIEINITKPLTPAPLMFDSANK